MTQTTSGMFDRIQRPTLLLNSAIAQENIHRIAIKAREQGVRFRPHFKTHQSAVIGEWFRSEGVTAITVSSVEMAQYFAQAGWYDITLAFPVNWRQIESLGVLSRQIRLGLLVESPETVQFLGERLDSPVDLWFKVDTGNHRTGLPWDQPAAFCQLAAQVFNYSNLHLRGLLTHAGNTYNARGAVQVCQLYLQSLDRIIAVQRALEGAGFRGIQISVGDTPSTSLCPTFGPVDEIRPGNFIFYDAQMLNVGACTSNQIAVTLACPVVASHPERSEVVVYGGAIHLSKDFVREGDQMHYGLVALPQGDGWSAPLPGAWVRSLSQEHGMIHIPPEDFSRIRVGDILSILPAHSCLTVQVMGEYLTLQGEVIPTLNRQPMA